MIFQSFHERAWRGAFTVSTQFLTDNLVQTEIPFFTFFRSMSGFTKTRLVVVNLGMKTLKYSENQFREERLLAHHLQ